MPELRFDPESKLFTSLADVPASYEGKNGFFVRVRADGTGLDFSKYIDVGSRSMIGISIGGVEVLESGNWQGDTGIGISPHGIFGVDDSADVQFVLCGPSHSTYSWWIYQSDVDSITWNAGSPGAGYVELALGDAAFTGKLYANDIRLGGGADLNLIGASGNPAKILFAVGATTYVELATAVGGCTFMPTVDDSYTLQIGNVSYQWSDVQLFTTQLNIEATSVININEDNTSITTVFHGPAQFNLDAQMVLGVRFFPSSTPSAPASGWIVWANSSDGKLKAINSASTTRELAVP